MNELTTKLMSAEEMMMQVYVELIKKTGKEEKRRPVSGYVVMLRDPLMAGVEEAVLNVPGMADKISQIRNYGVGSAFGDIEDNAFLTIPEKGIVLSEKWININDANDIMDRKEKELRDLLEEANKVGMYGSRLAAEKLKDTSCFDNEPLWKERVIKVLNEYAMMLTN